jgi:hypothetical protein
VVSVHRPGAGGQAEEDIRAKAAYERIYRGDA